MKGGHNIYKITHKNNLKVYITNNLELWLTMKIKNLIFLI